MGPALDTQTDPQPLLASWEKARWISQLQYGRLVVRAWGLSAGSVVCGLGLVLHPATVTTIMSVVAASLAAGTWAAVAHANTGPRRKLREAYDTWLYAKTQTESFREAFRAYTVAREEILEGSVAARRRRHNLFMEAAREAGFGASDERLGELCAVMDSEIEAVTAHAWEAAAGKLAAQRAALRRIEERTHAEELALAQRIRDAEELQRERRSAAQARLRSLVYAEGGPVPSSSIGVAVEAMREEVATAARDADAGRVHESRAAGVILNEQARWSAYAAPFHVDKELAELFGEGSVSRPVAARAKK